MNPTELYTGLRDYFSIASPNKYLCKTALLTGKVKIDILALDDFLHKKHGDYEDENLSMSMLIEREYGPDAHSFVMAYV